MVAILVALMALLQLNEKDQTAINEEMILFNTNNEEVVYYIKNDVLVVSATCEECVERLVQLSELSVDRQKCIDIVVISTVDEALNLLEKVKIESNVYVDEKKLFQGKYQIFSVPKEYRCENNELVDESILFE